MMRRRFALLLAALLLATTGCDRIRAALEERQELTDEQRAIQAYSDATPKVNLAQQRFVQSWELAVKNEQVAPLKAAIEKDVVPALDDYLKVLRSMPTGTPELERVHGIIIAAYVTMQSDVAAFRDSLSEENRKEPVDTLVERLGALTRAEDSYRKELKAYYEAHNITLVSEKTDEATAAHPAGDEAKRPDQPPAPSPKADAEPGSATPSSSGGSADDSQAGSPAAPPSPAVQPDASPAPAGGDAPAPAAPTPTDGAAAPAPAAPAAPPASPPATGDAAP